MTEKKKQTSVSESAIEKPKRTVKKAASAPAKKAGTTTAKKVTAKKVSEKAKPAAVRNSKQVKTADTKPVSKVSKAKTSAKAKKSEAMIAEDFAAAWLCARAMQNKKGEDIIVIDLRNVDSAPAEFFVLCTCDSTIQVRAVATEVDNSWRKQNWQIGRSEGWDAAEWIILDYFDIVVHVFEREKREFFKLEKLWSDGVSYILTNDGELEEKKMIKGSVNG